MYKESNFRIQLVNAHKHPVSNLYEMRLESRSFCKIERFLGIKRLSNSEEITFYNPNPFPIFIWGIFVYYKGKLFCSKSIDPNTVKLWEGEHITIYPGNIYFSLLNSLKFRKELENNKPKDFIIL